MRVQGTVEVPAARAELYATLSDPRRLEAALPAVDSIDLDGDDAFTVTAAPATALGVTPVRLSVRISDRRESEHVRLSGTGRAAEYAATFDVAVDFTDAGDGTAVGWVAEATFVGVLASLGQRILPAVLDQQVERVIRTAAAPA
jgi:carbon monoxide dehydrogenase subunit G